MQQKCQTALGRVESLSNLFSVQYGRFTLPKSGPILAAFGAFAAELVVFSHQSTKGKILARIER
jgi:hypothetical protein